MKVLSSILLSLYLILSVCLASEIQAEFSLPAGSSTLKEGDLVDGVLKVWPIESADLNEFNKLQNMTFFNSLSLIQIHSIEPSANNADLIEVKGLFLVKKSKDQSVTQINYKGQNISVQAPGLNITPLEKRAGDYFILDQSLSYSNLQKILLSLLAAALLFLGFWKRENLKSVIKKFKQDPTAVAIKNFNKKFLMATKREEFEEIYALRKDWLKLIKEQAPAYQEFFKVMDQHQYKKNWGAEEVSEVQNSFDVIRGSFK